MSRAIIALFGDADWVTLDDSSGELVWAPAPGHGRPTSKAVLELCQGNERFAADGGYYPDRVEAVAWAVASHMGGRVVSVTDVEGVDVDDLPADAIP